MDAVATATSYILASIASATPVPATTRVRPVIASVPNVASVAPAPAPLPTITVAEVQSAIPKVDLGQYLTVAPVPAEAEVPVPEISVAAQAEAASEPSTLASHMLLADAEDVPTPETAFH